MPLWAVKNVDIRDRSHLDGNAPEFPLRNCRKSQRHSSRITGFRNHPNMKYSASRNIRICVTLSLILSVVCETLGSFTYFITLFPIRRVSGSIFSLRGQLASGFSRHTSVPPEMRDSRPTKNKELPLPFTYFQFIIHFQRNFLS
jgi:hypothetical protein